MSLTQVQSSICKYVPEKLNRIAEKIRENIKMKSENSVDECEKAQNLLKESRGQKLEREVFCFDINS